MNLIVNNTNNIVWTQTDGEITQANGNYRIDNINVGILVSENRVVENANDCTFQFFFPETFTYVDGIWAIGNQEFYDANMSNLSFKEGNKVKAKRDVLLQTTDWTQLPNNPLASNIQANFATYRQALRDITKQSGYPFTVVFPILPVIPAENQPETTGTQTLGA
jgi:hypothetical protein